MKITDYAPRTAPFDHHLMRLKKGLLFGVEVGVDVGAHAHSLLQYNPNIAILKLVDIWDKEYARGWVECRMQTHGFSQRVEFIKLTSSLAAERLKAECFDFIYIDQLHDYESVSRDMELWWPLLNSGGIFGYRNYSESKAFPDLNRAIDEWVEKKLFAEKIIEAGEIIFIKP